MAQIGLVLGLLVVVAALGIAARLVKVPYPIVPVIVLEPDLVFLLFLPPLLYIAAFFTSVRDFKEQVQPILRLAVGLVLATTAVVAVIAHAFLPDLGWALAFALGAIVSPPDAVAATAIFRQVGVPRRLLTVLEGESMLNDATGLVTYRVAV